MFCKKCGNKIEGEVSFCGGCGDQIATSFAEAINKDSGVIISPEKESEKEKDGKKAKNIIWKKWWFWLIIIFFIFIWIVNSTSKMVEQVRDDAKQSIEKDTTIQQEKIIEKEKVESITLGQKNALKAAKNYLNFTPLSYSGLVDQLKFEGFSEQEARYGADYCGADWSEQAAKAAKNYLNMMSFSRSGLIEQLEFEGYTRGQAEYGVGAVGY